jgi:hypothetical protein
MSMGNRSLSGLTPALLRTIARARCWFEEVASGASDRWSRSRDAKNSPKR